MGTPRCANQQGAALKTKTQAASEPTHDEVVLTTGMGKKKREARVRRTNNLKKLLLSYNFDTVLLLTISKPFVLFFIISVLHQNIIFIKKKVI